MYRSERAETSDETEYMYTVYNSKQDGATTYIFEMPRSNVFAGLELCHVDM